MGVKDIDFAIEMKLFFKYMGGSGQPYSKKMTHPGEIRFSCFWGEEHVSGQD